MNQIRLLLIGLILIGVLLLGIGLYLAFRPHQPVIVQTNSTNTTAVPISQQTPFKISKNITVPSNVVWYDTGIEVAENAVININYKDGHWRNSPTSGFNAGEGRKPFDRQNLLLVPSAPLSSLVGKVGNNTFFVGNSYSGSPGKGTLYLAINDLPKTYNDNEGELDVLVEEK